MNILLIGGGGREHALAWKLNKSPKCSTLFISPGNAGTSSVGVNCDIAINDFEGIKELCIRENVTMLIVGPEEPLVKGIYDFFRDDKSLAHISVIGPSKEAAQLEGSKAYAKSFMMRHGVPTAAYREFTVDSYEEGVDYIRTHSLPVVLKADGLAAGKGVLICQNHMEALAEFELMIMRAKFGEAGSKVVIEEFLEGIEMSLFVLTDGKEYVILPEAKDYKRIGEGDAGLNTGGMGAVSPLPFYKGELKEKIINTIVKPTITGLSKDGLEYTGFVFIGLMINNNVPYVIEYNCRLGDPETEVVIPRLKNDLVELLEAAAKNQLSGIKIETDPRVAATVMAVSGGYPGHYEKGLQMSGLEEDGESLLFHAGTTIDAGMVKTNGGRVLAVTSFGTSIEEAARRSVARLQQVHFEDIYYRTDIGFEFSGEMTSNHN